MFLYIHTIAEDAILQHPCATNAVHHEHGPEEQGVRKPRAVAGEIEKKRRTSRSDLGGDARAPPPIIG